MKPVVAEIVQFNADRKPKLVRLKYERMAQDAFAFFRGTDHLFAANRPRWELPSPGPAVLLCGDLHIENFGAYRGDDGRFAFDINDFDEALIAPCGFDLVRCSASILLAADEWRLDAAEAASLVGEFLTHYRQTLAAGPPAPGDAMTLSNCSGAVRHLIGLTAAGTQAELLEQYTQMHAGRRRLVRNEKRFNVSEQCERIVRAAIEAYAARQKEPEAFEALDVTGRIAGVGSLGLRRYTVLIAGRQDNRLLDIKEVRAPAGLAATDRAQPDWASEAARVVAAQRRLQGLPTAGLDTIDLDGTAYRLREMIPDENRSRIDCLKARPEKLALAMEAFGQLSAWSHLRGAGLPLADPAEQIEPWAAGSAIEVLLAAGRVVQQTRRDYADFAEAYRKDSI